MHADRALTAIGLCLVLAACGGGHSSSGSAAATPPATPAASPLTAVEYPLQQGGSLVVRSDGSGSYQGIELSPSSATPVFAGATIKSGGGRTVETLGGVTGLSVAEFGVWYASNGPLTQPNFFAGGQGGPLISTNLPVSGQASYRGNYIATIGSTAVSGPMSVTADFGTSAVTTSFGGPINTTMGGGSGLNRNSGTYLTATSPGQGSTSGIALTAQGSFYGAGANETAGTISGSSTQNINHTTGPFGTITGSFGAHR
jgi:hypothetical protein